jgi:hypothetical protein
MPYLLEQQQSTVFAEKRCRYYSLSVPAPFQATGRVDGGSCSLPQTLALCKAKRTIARYL